jgi:hypothetical protein
MALRFNPLTGNFDFTGSGGGGGTSYIDGEVATFNDLPLDGSAAIDNAWLVREASGTWLIARKPAGIYIRTATGGTDRDADWTYAGILPDVFNDANFLLYDDADSTKNLAFQLSGITTGQTRTLTVPDANGTIALTGQLTDTQIFTANGTWTKPAGAKYCDVTVIGGGGGGGAGRRGASGTNRGGGAGGTGAGISRYIVEASQLGATESVVVGAGGAGGTDSADDTDGANGSDGGDSSFWVLTGRLGSGGAGGNSTAVAAGTGTAANRCAIFGTAFARSAGGSGGFDGTGAASSGTITVQPAGGGGGARIRSTNLTNNFAGSNGGRLQIGTTGNEAISLLGDSNGVGYSGLGGKGGGFNPSDFSGVAGNGGGLYGGGGGGGGGALNAVGGSTAGGNGANGVVVITTYF